MSDTKLLRLEEGKRFIEWIKDYPKEWSNMFAHCEGSMDVEECLKYIVKMENEEFYQMIPVLIKMNFNSSYMWNAMRSVSMKYMSKTINEKGLLNFIDDLKTALAVERLNIG